MKLFTGARAAGKTTRLVEWLVEHPDRYLLTAYGKQHLEGIVREVVDRKVHPRSPELFSKAVESTMSRVFTMDEMSFGRRPQARDQQWAIDDVDRVLEQLVRGPVSQATHSLDLQVENL